MGLFLALLLLSSVPLLAMTIWVERTALEKEYSAVSEKHLIVAKNLSLALSRYVVDIENMIELYAHLAESKSYDLSISQELNGLDLLYVAVLGPDNNVEHQFVEKGGKSLLPDPILLAKLRALSDEAKGNVMISNIERYEGQQFFFVVKNLSGGRFILAPLSPRYLRSIQRSIAFGDKGHAMIVDSLGRVVAHPNINWEASAKDASKVPAVQKMMARKSGVIEFYAPPMKADVIAGYTFVPETGWGVMVPQPVSELVEHARNVQHTGLIIAAIALLLSVVISWLLSSFFSQPVIALSNVATRISNGDRIARAEIRKFWVPVELKMLAKSFNDMVADLHLKSDQLSDALIEARAGSKAKTEFMATISHELRTPINGVVGLLEILEDTALDKDQKNFVESCQGSAKHLIDIVDDILCFSQLEAGRIKLDKQRVDFKKIMFGVEYLFSDQASKRGISLQTNASTSVPEYLVSDDKRLRQILFNIVGNALKFTEAGKIVISAEFEPAAGSSGSLNFSVSDTGIGISADESLDIFVPFNQVDSSHSRQYDGNGLGLSITKHLVEIMDGKIWYKSNLGVGTTFYVSIPVNSEIGDDG